MDTNRQQENISAMVDGELPPCDVELTMVALATPHGRATWHAYQLIGDVLRASAAGTEPGPDFRARLAVRLAQEPMPAAPPADPPAALPDGPALPLPLPASSPGPASDGEAPAAIVTR